jgi:PKD repeat protein
VFALPKIAFQTKNETPQRIRFTPSDTSLASYTWDFGDGGTSTDKVPTHTYNVIKGKFNVTLNVVTKDGCKGSYSDTAYVGATSITDPGNGVTNLVIYPNPFRNTTQISLTLDKRAPVTIDLYDMLGRKITSIANSTLERGPASFEIDADKLRLTPGVYFIHLTVNSATMVQKITLTK